jgi:hypothetical protein
MRHYLWIAVTLASAGLAGAGCSTTGTQRQVQADAERNLRGPVGNGAFGEAVPAQYGEPAATHSTSGAAGSGVEGHGFTGNGAFGETP